ncbi:MAG: Yip1 family protein [Pseudomonadota bacterium]
MKLIGRATALLLNPKAEWTRIEAEPTTVRAIMTGWVAPLAAIGPIVKLIGSQVAGVTGDGMHMPPPLISAVTEALIGYALSLLGVYVLARIVNGLAVTFKGRRDEVQAMKLAAYGATAMYLAGVFELLPILRWFEFAGLYSMVLIFVGLPIVMHAPKKRVLAYTAVTLLAGIGLIILLTLTVLWTKDMFAPDVPASAWNYTPPE